MNSFIGGRSILFNNKRLSSSANQLLDGRLRGLRPDIIGEKKYFNQILEEIRREIQRAGHPFNQGEFYIAGSFAKNTMLSSHREFDIIISLPSKLTDYPPTVKTKDQFREEIAEIFTGKDPYVPENGFNVKIHVSDVSIDILPSFEISINQFLDLASDQRLPYKGRMSLYHIVFMQNRGNLFQDCCRLMKYWAHGPAHKSYAHYTSSWFLELVTAGSFQHTNPKNYSAVFEMTLRRIKNIQRRRKWKYKYFAFSDFYQLTPDLRQKYLPELAVLEPTDPDDNLATRGLQATRLNKLVVRAKETLELWKNDGFSSVFQEYFSRGA